MKNVNIVSRLPKTSKFVLALFLLASPLAYTYAACCAGHGGVASCNKTTGYQMCKDGTASPSCTCPKQKTKATKATPKPTPTPTKKTTTSKPATSTTTSPNGTSARGCCSNHGGIAQCNKVSGYQMCKDGSQSPSCTCH